MLLRLVEISSSPSEKLFLFACNVEKLLRFWRRQQFCSMVMTLNAWEKPRTDPRIKMEDVVTSLEIMMSEVALLVFL